MVRPVGGRAVSNQRTAIPSAGELLGQVSKTFAGLPTAASSGEFGGIEFLGEIDKYYKPQSFGEANRRNQAGDALAQSIDADAYYIDSDGNYVDRSSYRQSYDEDDDTGELIILVTKALKQMKVPLLRHLLLFQLPVPIQHALAQ